MTVLLNQDLSKETAHQKVLENVDWQGFGEPSRHLVIIPLRAKEQIKGYVTLGLNPRGKLDADHEQFIADLARQLTGLVARVTNEEQTQKRENTLMTELSDTEKRINRLAEIVPVGIYEQAANGSVLWCNKQFFDILGVPHDQRDVRIFDWRDYIIPEDISRAGEDMGRCLSAAVELSGSVRLRRHYQPPRIGHDSQPDEEPFWIMYSASPDVRADGTVQSLMGCLADISHLKWTEQVHIRNAEQARRDRKRQEEFIDITSHEMRNPLSAITQCADSVILSLQDAKTTSTAQSLIELIKLNAEAAESILFCAAHQRRIIDDVLTLGKLDSRLLTIFPTPFHPSNLIDQALQMFKTEIEVNAIDVQISLDDTRALAGTPLVYGDTSRLMQILVNLLTNAIKFTRTQQVRHITIRYGSSQDIPSADRFAPGFEWHSTGITHPDLTLESDYGQGEAVYLYYAVIDSGTGVPPGFIEKVFSKFEQADRRTHTKYGGSGLGLYISRELAEMQGGHIGISSIDGVGSTFAFYTKARCAEVQPIGQVELVTRSRSVTKATQASGAQILERCSFPTSLPPPINYNILLVEDNLLNQKVLAKQLKIAGCAVQVSDNGGEAIDAVLRIHKQPVEFGTLPSSEENTLPYFDCILMDWEMPVCDGLRATKRIREIETQHGSGKNIIIGVTANARAEQIAVAMKAGMDTVMPKPFRVAELLAKIGELVAL
jgi:signal transduction histidine kinase